MKNCSRGSPASISLRADPLRPIPALTRSMLRNLPRRKARQKTSPDCGLRIADCGLKKSAQIRNPQSAIRNPMNYQSSAKIPLWRPAAALLGEHRGLVRSMVRRDLSSRYKGSIIGPAWAIITPAVMIIIFTAIFSGIFGARFGAQSGHLSFAVYLFCGLLPWIAFSEGVQRSTTSLTDNVNLVKRVVFPTEALPVNLALSGVAQQLIGTVVLLAGALLLEHTIRPTALLLPLLLVPQLLLTVGLGWLMASLGVFIRDMPQLNQLSLTIWMYLTPIFYPENIIPQ